MYVVLLKYTENRNRADRFMEGHRAWIRQGFDDGTFVLAGGLEPELGGGILVHRTSRPELDRRIGADPFVREGIVSAEVLELSPAKTDARLSFLVDE